MEPMVGIEPTTYGLRNRCSTTELHWLGDWPLNLNQAPSWGKHISVREGIFSVPIENNGWSSKHSACGRSSFKIMMPATIIMDAPPMAPEKQYARLKFILRKAATVAIVTVIFGWLYGWAAPWAYASPQRAGFVYGLLHGAMMPLSLPSLVVGKDVPIYDPVNVGRLYKIGYICGVNICGLVFIGPIFWRPRGAVITSTSSGKSQ
jgi:hypothetical protein